MRRASSAASQRRAEPSLTLLEHVGAGGTSPAAAVAALEAFVTGSEHKSVFAEAVRAEAGEEKRMCGHIFRQVRNRWEDAPSFTRRPRSWLRGSAQRMAPRATTHNLPFAPCGMPLLRVSKRTIPRPFRQTPRASFVRAAGSPSFTRGRSGRPTLSVAACATSVMRRPSILAAGRPGTAASWTGRPLRPTPSTRWAPRQGCGWNLPLPLQP